MAGAKRKQRRKNLFPKPINKYPRSSRVTTKNFEVFVTDFLIDPCGLPMELQDYVLVDGTNSSPGFHPKIKLLNMQIDYLEIVSCNNNQVLKNIFANNESIERLVNNSSSFVVEGSCN